MLLLPPACGFPLAILLRLLLPAACRHAARQCLLVRGLMPMLAAPSPSGDVLLEEAVNMACRMGLVGPNNHIIVVQRLNEVSGAEAERGVSGAVGGTTNT